MDRLPALITVCLVASAACDTERRRPVATERVNAVRAAPKKKATVESFCDVYAAPKAAPAFILPALAEPAEPSGVRWQWLNVWATWCKPCVAEMPSLLRWHEQLVRAGKPVNLVFLSVDESAEKIAAYRKEHPTTPETLRVEDPDDLGPWVASLGLDENAAIPIHAFVADDKLVCVRTGALGPNHFDTLSDLLSR